jgi:ABC-type proline/glycine betaine transport system permease subunit
MVLPELRVVFLHVISIFDCEKELIMIRRGLLDGIPIVILAIIIDRTFQSLIKNPHSQHSS